MDGVKDHIVPHIVNKKMTQEMWKALTALYEGKSVKRRKLMENQLQ